MGRHHLAETTRHVVYGRTPSEWVPMPHRVMPPAPAPAATGPSIDRTPTMTHQLPTQPAAKRRRWPWIIGLMLGGLVLLGAIGSGGGQTPAPVTPAAGPTSATPAPAPTPEPAAAPDGLTAGTYEVGTDIEPGKYRTTGPASDESFDLCYFERLSGTEGTFDEIIANEVVQGPGVVTIRDSDAAVGFSGSCTWTLAP